MRRHRTKELLEHKSRQAPVHPVHPGDRIEEMQLKRLANAVLSKSPTDLAALAETNPMIVWEWIEAFRRQKLQADAELRYWSSAMAALSTATPEAVRTAAE